MLSHEVIQGVRAFDGSEPMRSERLKRVYKTWTSIAEADHAPVPRWDSIDLLAFTEDIKHLGVVDVIRGGESFRVRFIGTELVRFLGRDVTGQEPGAWTTGSFVERTLVIIREVSLQRRPMLNGPIRTRLSGKDLLDIESLSLPCTNDMGLVTHVLGVFDTFWRDERLAEDLLKDRGTIVRQFLEKDDA